MPPKAGLGSSKLVQKLGLRVKQAHDKHKGDAIKLNNFGNLPPGLDGAIAQLKSCEIRFIAEGKDHAGELEFYAVGIMIEPENFPCETPPKSGNVVMVPIRGKQTYYHEALYDTSGDWGSKTFDDHYAKMLNVLRIFGYEDALAGASVEDVESLVEAINVNKPKPYFKIRTSLLPAREGSAPRVYEDWHVGRPDEKWKPPKINADTDNTAKREVGPAQSTNGAAPKAETPPDENLEFGDLDSLLEAASSEEDSKEKEAAEKELTRLAIAAGKSKQEVAAAESWEVVVGWLRGEGERGDEGIKVGDHFKVKLPKMKIPSQVEIVAVNDNDTVDVKNLSDNKVHKGIPVANLIDG